MRLKHRDFSFPPWFLVDVKGQSFLILSISDEKESGDVEPNFMLVCEDSPQRNKKTRKVWK